MRKISHQYQVVEAVSEEQVRKSHVGGMNLEGALILEVRESLGGGELGPNLSLRCHVEFWTRSPTNPDMICVVGIFFPGGEDFAATLTNVSGYENFGIVSELLS